METSPVKAMLMSQHTHYTVGTADTHNTTLTKSVQDDLLTQRGVAMAEYTLRFRDESLSGGLRGDELLGRRVLTKPRTNRRQSMN